MNNMMNNKWTINNNQIFFKWLKNTETRDSRHTDGTRNKEPTKEQNGYTWYRQTNSEPTDVNQQS